MLDLSYLSPDLRLTQAEEMTSTMDVAADLAQQGAGHLHLVVAERMTHGRGRRGRAWHTAAGHQLLLTIIVRQGVGPHLGLLASLAVQEVLADMTGGLPFVKWPNDVVWEAQKVAGILVENITLNPSKEQNSSPFQLVHTQVALLGIGINVTTPPDGWPDDVSATSIEKAAGIAFRREEILQHLVDTLGAKLARYAQVGWPAFAENYAKVCITLGQTVTWHQEDHEEISGTATGLTEDGALQIQDADGVVHCIHAGEVMVGSTRQLA